MRLPNLLDYALVSFVTANVIHNSGGVDPAIVPATTLAAAHWWRPGPGLLRATAIAITLPALLFLKWTALTDPASTKPFLNHLALLLAAILASTSATLGLLPRRRTRP
jgi:hypothetical protein